MLRSHGRTHSDIAHAAGSGRHRTFIDFAKVSAADKRLFPRHNCAQRVSMADPDSGPSDSTAVCRAAATNLSPKELYRAIRDSARFVSEICDLDRGLPTVPVIVVPSGIKDERGKKKTVGTETSRPPGCCGRHLGFLQVCLLAIKPKGVLKGPGTFFPLFPAGESHL